MSLVLLFLTMALFVTVQCAVITDPPLSVNVSLNSTVTFTCRGIGDFIGFRVDNVLATDSNVTDRGFTAPTPMSNAGTITGSLIAVAYESNNNTNITCTINSMVAPFFVTSSPPAVLMIQGILDVVGDLMATVIDGSNVSLTWTPPYSLDNVPITGYNIITSDGINITVNTTYHILSSSDPDPCNITTVSVGAINDVGTSQYNNVSFYYQTAPPQSDGIVSITNGNRDGITVVVDLSSLCVGERPNNITINVIYSNDVVYTTDISMILNDQLTIHHMITLQNDWIEYFVVNVTLSNRGGETSYPFPLGHLGPVNNITSSSTDCSIINVSWSRPPSVHDRVNIHNYTLRRYNDNGLVSSVTVNGNTTSYEFVDEELFSHEYTYEICGNNELGEGNCINGTFSYLRVSTSVRNDTTLTQIDDNTLNYNIPFINECPDNSSVTINITIVCNDTESPIDGVVFNRREINISGNITIMSQYESCQLNVTLTNTNGISTTYVKVLQLSYSTTTSTIPPSSSNPPLSLGVIIGIVIGVSAGFLLGICLTLICICCFCYCYKRSKSKDNNDNNDSNDNDNNERVILKSKELEKMASSTSKDDKHVIAVATTNTIQPSLNIVTGRNNKSPSDVFNEQTSSTTTHSESADLLCHHQPNDDINAPVKKPSVVPGVIYESVQVAKERPIAPPSAVDPVIYSDIDHMRQAPPHPHANRPMSTVTVLPSGVSEDTPPAIPAKRRQDKPSSSDDIPLLPGQVNNSNTTTTTTTDDNATSGLTVATYL